MKKIRFFLIIGISLIVLSESYLRIFHFETLKKFKRDLAYIPDSLYGYRYEANSVQEFIWPDINKKFKFNNHGFYGPDFSKYKKNNSYRIIFVGNSNTLGIRTDGKDNFVMKLQNLFTQAGYNVEIINCSVDGVNRDIANFNKMKYEVPEFNPDLIMFEYRFPLKKRHIVRDVYKDIQLKYEYSMRDSLQVLYSELDKIYSAKFLCKLYDASYIVRGLCRWLINNKKSSFAKFFNENILEIKWINTYVKKEKDWGNWKKVDEYFEFDESYKMYLDLEDYLDSLGIKLATYSLSSGINKSFPIHPNFVIDQIDWSEELFLPHEGHINNKAHELIAKEMFYILINSSIPVDNYKNVDSK